MFSHSLVHFSGCTIISFLAVFTFRIRQRFLDETFHFSRIRRWSFPESLQTIARIAFLLQSRHSAFPIHRPLSRLFWLWLWLRWLWHIDTRFWPFWYGCSIHFYQYLECFSSQKRLRCCYRTSLCLFDRTNLGKSFFWHHPIWERLYLGGYTVQPTTLKEQCLILKRVNTLSILKIWRVSS
jgi:hypothetical protein